MPFPCAIEGGGSGNRLADGGWGSVTSHLDGGSGAVEQACAYHLLNVGDGNDLRQLSHAIMIPLQQSGCH